MGAVPDPEEEDANMFDAQEEVQRQRQERATQTETARANVGVQIGSSLRSAHTGVQTEIHQVASASSSSSAPQPGTPSGPPPRRQRTQRARSPGAMTVDPPPIQEQQPVVGGKPPPTPTNPVVLGKWAANAAAQARQKRQAAKDAILKAPEPQEAGVAGAAGDAAMRMDPTHAGQKRGLDHPEVQEKIKRAARGDRVVPNFPEIVHRRAVTPAMIEQQLIMQGVFIISRQRRTHLESLIHKRWSEDVPEETARKRLREYQEKHGSLPLAISDNKPENKPEAKAATAADAKPEAKSSKSKERGLPASSSHQRPTHEAEEPHKLNEGEEDIRQYQQASIVAPARTTITILIDRLMKAHPTGQIEDEKDNQKI